MTHLTFKIFVIGILLFILTGCTVPVPTKENTTILTGVLSEISTCCEGGDVLVRLEGNTNIFYLNRAIEAGFDLELFKDEVSIGDTVSIRVFTQYLPVEPTKSTSHTVPLAEIATADRVFYSTMPDSSE